MFKYLSSEAVYEFLNILINLKRENLIRWDYI